MQEREATQTLAQLTGADAAFWGLVQWVARGLLANEGQPDGAVHPEALRVQAELNGLYPEFEASYAKLFVEHVGPEHAPVVLAALQREPMRKFLRARAAMKADLAVELRQLTQRMGQLAL